MPSVTHLVMFHVVATSSVTHPVMFHVVAMASVTHLVMFHAVTTSSVTHLVMFHAVVMPLVRLTKLDKLLHVVFPTSLVFDCKYFRALDLQNMYYHHNCATGATHALA